MGGPIDPPAADLARDDGSPVPGVGNTVSGASTAAPTGRGDHRRPVGTGRKDLMDAASVVSINRSVPHGHVAAVWAIAQQLGLPALLGPAGRAALSTLTA